jgi:hypothetical protein
MNEDWSPRIASDPECADEVKRCPRCREDSYGTSPAGVSPLIRMCPSGSFHGSALGGADEMKQALVGVDSDRTRKND